jgi:hypothetical protein
MIIPLGNRLIVTDLESSSDPSAVFPIYPETLYLIEQIPKQAASVLDIGTGSGIVSVFATDCSSRVTAADISDRALLFAEFNATLNGVRDNIGFQETNLLSEFAGSHYECICANLPFEPVPPGYSYFLHSDGGPDGLKLVREFLEQINKRVLEFGQIRMVTFSLGNDKHMIIEDVVRQELGRGLFDVEIEVLAKSMRFAQFAERFQGAPNFDAWLDSTLQNGLDLLFFVGIKIVPSRTFCCRVTEKRFRDWGRWDNPVNWTENSSESFGVFSKK